MDSPNPRLKRDFTSIRVMVSFKEPYSLFVFVYCKLGTRCSVQLTPFCFGWSCERVRGTDRWEEASTVDRVLWKKHSLTSMRTLLFLDLFGFVWYRDKSGRNCPPEFVVFSKVEAGGPSFGEKNRWCGDSIIGEPYAVLEQDVMLRSQEAGQAADSDSK